MRRREFIAGLGSAAAWPAVARAQQGKRVRRIGALMAYDESDHTGQDLFSAFKRGLAELGWTDGDTVRLDVRWGSGNIDRMRVFAKELVDLQPDVILADSTPVTALCSGRRGRSRSYSLKSPTPSDQASSRVWPGPAGISLASSTLSPQWSASGWSSSRRLRPASTGSQPCSTPIRRPMSENITCQHSRLPRDHSKYRRSRRPFTATRKLRRS